ncbi:MAG: hypothetical protein J6P69_03530, partial [Bacteroidales bacterium]|nr:hypothetical protein [Bacteroidales bacterium]
LEDFCRKFKLFSSSAYYAIKYIEMSGYWSLTEEIDISSRINMLVDREALYSQQLGQDLDTLLNVIMRMYPGLFGGFITIDEEKIAASGHYSVLAVEAKFKRLEAKRILKYVPKVKSPILNIVNERLYEKNLHLPKDEYQARVDRNMTRIAAMEEYVRTAADAPEKFLIKYFGV